MTFPATFWGTDMTRIQTLLLRAAAVAALSAAPMLAHAGVVYSNETVSPAQGDCSFNTACAGAIPSRGNEFAAQAFSLAGATTLTGGSWIEMDSGGAGATSVNYAFYNAAGGLPSGAAIFSGSATTFAHDLGVDSANTFFETFRESFSLPSLALGAGNYFFAIQSVSSNFANYLGQGVLTTGAAESNDGGLTWTPGYETLPGGGSLGGVGVALYNGAFNAGAPEPTTWALMLMGFGGLGASLRSRRRVAIA